MIAALAWCLVSAVCVLHHLLVSLLANKRNKQHGQKKSIDCERAAAAAFVLERTQVPKVRVMYLKAGCLRCTAASLRRNQSSLADRLFSSQARREQSCCKIAARHRCLDRQRGLLCRSVVAPRPAAASCNMWSRVGTLLPARLLLLAYQSASVTRVTLG